jgi:hypothetical protein
MLDGGGLIFGFKPHELARSGALDGCQGAQEISRGEIGNAPGGVGKQEACKRDCFIGNVRDGWHLTPDD